MQRHTWHVTHWAHSNVTLFCNAYIIFGFGRIIMNEVFTRHSPTEPGKLNILTAPASSRLKYQLVCCLLSLSHCTLCHTTSWSFEIKFSSRKLEKKTNDSRHLHFSACNSNYNFDDSTHVSGPRHKQTATTRTLEVIRWLGFLNFDIDTSGWLLLLCVSQCGSMEKTDSLLCVYFRPSVRFVL